MFEAIKYLVGSSAGPSGYGSRSTAEDVTLNSSHLHSITAIITGGTSGIGAETARVLAKRGARIILPSRSYKAGADTKSRILSECPQAQVLILPLDLSSQSSVRTFVHLFHSLRLPLNLLINNAGKFSHRHGIPEDAVEMTFATNYLGHYLLTKLLLKTMMETAEKTGIQGRIVNVSSFIHTWFTGDPISYLHLITRHKPCYDATRAYALSKLANVLHTTHLALHLTQIKANVTVNCVHPGIVRTRLTRDREGFISDVVFFLASKLLKTIPQAAATTCYVGTHSKVENVTGKYFADCNETRPSKLGSNSYEAQRLWTISQILTSHHHNPKSIFFNSDPPNHPMPENF